MDYHRSVFGITKIFITLFFVLFFFSLTVIKANNHPLFAQEANIPCGFDNPVSKTIVQLDGKILVWGSFNTYCHKPVSNFVRLNSDGSLDTTFKNSQLGDFIFYYVETVILKSDGKMLVGGMFLSSDYTTRSGLIRVNNDGSLDTTFNAGEVIDNYADFIVPQEDGKLIVSWRKQDNADISYVVRLNSNGSLDSSFNLEGSGFDNRILDIKLQENGKILVGGQFNSYNGTSARYVLRLNNDGSLDTTFVQTGSGFYDSNSANHISMLAIQEDGKILAGGYFNSYNGTNAPYLARLNSDGSLDTTFVQEGSGLNDEPESIVALENGKILVGGAFYLYNEASAGRFAVLNSDGSLDAASMESYLGVNDSVYDIAIQPDGKILLNGSFSSYGETSIFVLARLNSDYTLDTTFVASAPGFDAIVSSILPLPDGKMLIGVANYWSEMGGIMYLSRINSDASIDLTFNTNGSGFDGGVNALALQEDGKIIVAGDFSSYNGVSAPILVRLNSDGSLDTSFVIEGVTFDHSIYSITIQEDGKILVGGSFQFSGRPYLLRLNSDGSLDTTFVQTGSGLSGGGVYTIVAQEDGKILVGGQFSSYNEIARSKLLRLNSDGSLDTTFTQTGSGLNGQIVLSIILQPDEKIITSGMLSSYNGTSVHGTVRFNNDGTLDSTFDVTGIPESEAMRVAYSSVLQSDGKIIVGGFKYISFGEVSFAFVSRLNSDGSLDTTFDQMVNQFGAGAQCYIRKLSLLADGRIIAGGIFPTFNGTYSPNLVGINSDGSLDETFITTGLSQSPVSPSVLKTNDSINPSGIVGVLPKFSALLTSTATKYQIQVNTSSLFTGTSIWDSGAKTFSTPVFSNNRTPDISYAGNALTLDGTKYYWRMRIWNSAGDVSEWSDTNDFTMASYTLNAPFGLAISPSTYNNTNSFRFTWSAGNARVKNYEYKAGWNWISTISNNVNSLQAYKNGQNIVQVRSVDNAGNRSVASAISYYYDSIAPTVPTNLVATDTTFSWTASNDEHSGLVGYEYKVGDTTSWISTGSTLISSQLGLKNGENTLYVRAIDKAGNKSEPASITYTYDNQDSKADSSDSPQMSFTREGSNTSIQNDTVAVKSGESITVTIPVSEITVEGDSISQVYIEVDGEKTLLVLNVERKVYTAQVSIPTGKTKGSKLQTNQVIEYSSGERSVKGINIVIDPYGYVYAKSGEKEIRLENAKVSLYSYVNGNKELYTFSDGTQNPQNTNSDGEYNYFVPSGKYVLVVELEGYKTFTSDVFEVSNGAVEQNIEMKKKLPISVYVIGGGVFILLCVGILALKKKEIDY